jgi:hypothetical protein
MAVMEFCGGITISTWVYECAGKTTFQSRFMLTMVIPYSSALSKASLSGLSRNSRS